MAEEVVGLLRHVLQLDRSDLAKGFALAGADADAFKRKVDKAMTDAERSLAKPEQAVRRLEAAMRGDRLLASANNIAAAINKVGGATKLTEAEQARYNATLQKAVEKYRLLGKEAPAALLAAEAATRKAVAPTDALAKGMTDVGTKATLAQRGTNALVGSIGQMAAGFTLATVAMRAFGGLVNLGRQAIETSDHLVDMSAKTGLSTEMLQRLDFVADQAGGTLDDFTDASFRLGVKLSSGSGGVNKAVSELGLNLAALRAAKPDEQLMLIVDALAKVEDESERNRIGTALFGKQYASMASAVAQNMGEIAKAARVMSDEQVKSLADAKDEWGRFYRDLTVLSGSWLANSRMELIDARKGWSAFFSDMGNQINKLRNLMLIGPKEWSGGSTIGKGDVELRAEPKASVKKPDKSSVERLREIDTELKNLTKTQRAEVDASLALGEAHEKLESDMGLSEGAIGRYVDLQREATKETNKAETAAQKLAKAHKELKEEIFGQSALNDAKLMTDALFESGPVDFSRIGQEQLEQIKATSKKAIDIYKRMGAEIPRAVQMAFNGSARQIGSVMDVSALKGLTLQRVFDPSAKRLSVSDDGFRQMWGQDQASFIDIENMLHDAAIAAQPFSRVDTSQLFKDWKIDANGALVPLRELSDIVDDMVFEFRQLSGMPNPMQSWILQADILADSASQLVADMDWLAEHVPGLASTTAQGFSRVLAGMSMTGSPMAHALNMMTGRQFMDAQGKIHDITTQGRIAGAAEMVGGFGSIIGQGENFTDSIQQGDSRSGRAMAGMGKGAQMGMAFGPQGAAVGAIWGLTVGALSAPAEQGRKRTRAYMNELADLFDEVASASQRAEAETETLQDRVEGGFTGAYHRAWILVRDAYEATGQTADRAKKDFEELRAAAEKGPDAVARAMEKINKQIERQAKLLDARQQKQELLNAAVQRWSIAFDKAGKGFQSGQLAQQAETFIQDWQLLTESGAAPADVAQAMSKAMSEFVQQVRRTGVEVPEAMRPMLETMMQQGRLFDENGLLFRDMSDMGIKFGRGLETLFENVLLKLDRLIEKLTAPLPDVPVRETTPISVLTGAQAVQRKHMGGVVERAHNGTVVGRHLFGRLAPDEMPMILQRGEAVINRMMTNRMGGAPTVDALNRGDLFGAASRIAPRDPFADMGRLIEMPNRFHVPETQAQSLSSGIAAKGAGDTNVQITIQSGAINVNGSGNPAHDADVILNEVVSGLHTNRKGFRTKVIQKVAKGN